MEQGLSMRLLLGGSEDFCFGLWTASLCTTPHDAPELAPFVSPQASKYGRYHPVQALALRPAEDLENLAEAEGHASAGSHSSKCP